MNLIKIGTYEHFDGYYILLREDTGQEVARQDLQLIKLLNPKFPILKFDGDSYLEKQHTPKGTNALVNLEYKIAENCSIRGIYYAKLRLREDEGIRSLTKRKVF
ncbi:hypothetical protein GW932_04865 [archaeon]|nr:hypothetical protein [archaeon]